MLIVAVLVGRVVAFSDMVEIKSTIFWGTPTLHEYPNSDPHDAFKVCKAFDGCHLFSIRHSDAITKLHSLEGATPSHNTEWDVWLMADAVKQSPYTSYWWKKIECVDFRNSGDTGSWTQKSPVEENIWECERRSECDAVVVGKGTAYGKKLSKVGASTRDCDGRSIWIREADPWTASKIPQNASLPEFL